MWFSEILAWSYKLEEKDTNRLKNKGHLVGLLPSQLLQLFKGMALHVAALKHILNVVLNYFRYRHLTPTLVTRVFYWNYFWICVADWVTIIAADLILTEFTVHLSPRRILWLVAHSKWTYYIFDNILITF